MSDEQCSDIAYNAFFHSTAPEIAIELADRGTVFEEGADSDITTTVLADAVDTSFPAAVKVVNKLERADVITKRADGRRKLIYLTPKGKEIVDSIARTIEKIGDLDDGVR